MLYWFQSHDRYIASEYTSKVRLVLDSVSMNRSDGALVRIVTPVASGENEMQATTRAAEFAETTMKQLPAFIPR